MTILSMMLSLQTTQYRLAQHYLSKLQKAERATQRGRQNRVHWLNVVQQDWAQIKQWQAWSASWVDTEIEKARLCSAFPLATSSVLRIRQPPNEFLIWVQQALEAARKLNDSGAERTLLYYMCVAHLNMESMDAVDQYAHQLLDLAQALNDSVGLGRAWYMLGATNVFRGAYDKAESLLEKSLKVLSVHHASEELAAVWKNLGSVAFYRGDYRQAYNYHLKYLDVAITSESEGITGIAHLSLSGILICLHDYQAAEFHAQQAVAISRRIGFTRYVPVALLSLAHAEKWLGNFASACLHYEEALAQRSIMTPSTVVNAVYGLGQARFRLGDLDGAFDHFDEALNIAREKKIQFRLCEVLPDMVVLHLTRNESGAAQERLHECVTVTMQLRTPAFYGKSARCGCECMVSVGQG